MLLLNDLDVITLTCYEQRSSSILVHASPANTQNVRHQLLNELDGIRLTCYEQQSSSILVHASPANTQNVRHQLLNELDGIRLTCYEQRSTSILVHTSPANTQNAMWTSQARQILHTLWHINAVRGSVQNVVPQENCTQKIKKLC